MAIFGHPPKEGVQPQNKSGFVTNPHTKFVRRVTYCKISFSGSRFKKVRKAALNTTLLH